MGRQPHRARRPHRPGGDVRRGRARSSPGSASRIDPRRPARGLSIADQQIIEIAKAISLDASLLDHGRADRGAERGRGRPALRGGPQPARRGPGPGLHLPPLRRGLRALRHRHRDARRRLRLHRRDRRDDRRPRSSSGWSAARSATSSRRRPAEVGDVVLEVDGLHRAGTFHDISFTVRSGEIVGLAGLVGAGRSEIARAVFGVDRYDAGTVRLGGRRVPAHDPQAAIRAGIGVRPRGPPQAGPGHRGLGRAQRRQRRSAVRLAQAGPAHQPAPRTASPARGPAGSRSRPARSTWTPAP